MPERDIGAFRKANRRNEYVMFADPKIKISRNSQEGLELYAILSIVATYAPDHNTNLTVSDTIDFGTDEEWDGAVILLPEIMEKTNIVKCYISTKQYITVF